MTPPPTSAKGLRDKIAKFEKRGRVPAPRGSFGLGAPPLAENGPQKRRGELYGNRIPNGVRVSYSGTSLSRSGSPFDSARSFSVPHTDGEDGEMPDSPSYLPSPFSSPPSSPVSPDSLFTSVYPVQPSTPDYDGCNREITATSSPIIAIPMSERSQPEDEHLEAEVTQPSIVISSEELILEVPSIQKNTLAEVAQQSVQSTYPTSSPSIPAPLVNAAIPSPAVHEPKEPPSHIEVSEPLMLPELLFGSPASPPSASGEDHAPESITLQAPPEKGSIHTEERSVELTPDTANVSQALSEKGPSLANTHIEGRNVELIANTKNAVQMPLGNGFRSTPPHSEAHPAQLVADTAKVLQTPQEKDLSLTPTRTGGHSAKLASDAVKQMSPPKKDISIIPTHITPTDPASPFLAKEHILNLSDTTARQNIVISLPADEDVVLESPSPLPNPYDDNLLTTTSLEPLFENAHVIVGPSTPTPLNDEAAIYDDKSEHHLEEQVITTETTAREDFTSPESPIGPHTLANVVASLGQMVADIHHLFPDQLSPLNSPPMYRPMTLEPTPESKPSRNSDSGKETKKPVNLTIHLDSETGLESKEIKPNTAFGTQAATSTPEALAAADSLNAPSDSTESALIASPSSSFLSTPSSTHVRPISMVETSPAQVEVGKRVTLLPRRTVYIPPQAQQRDLIHFPPTPGPQAVDMQFGTVSIGHTTTHSRKTSFSAVVHGKIADMPSASSMPSMLSAPTTPSKRNTIAGEAVTSPGQGELASLLQSAALLEETLEKGELPGEVSPDAASVKRAKEEQEKAEAEGKVKTEEERKAAAVKNRVSAQPQKRMKRSFLMLSGKSSQQRDRSVSSPEGQTTDSKDLTDRPHLPCKSTEGSGRLSESSSFQTVHAPSVEIHAESPEREADTNSHTSPKSPRQYLASLRRFASGGRASTGSNGTHPRLSASTSSEMSSDDSVPLATPPDNGLDSAGSGSSVRSSYGSGIPWPSLSPKKNGSVGRAAAFAGKIWNRGRSKSSNSPYETIGKFFQFLEPSSF